MKTYLAVSALLISSGTIYAQETASPPEADSGAQSAYERRVERFDAIAVAFEKTFKGFTVAKSVEDKNAAVEPASIAGVHSRESGNSTAIDVGVTWDIWRQKDFDAEIDSEALNKLYWSIGPKLEYHRNDVGGDKEQDSLQAGFAIAARNLRAPTNLAPDPLNFHYETTFKYKNDRIKNGQGVSSSFAVSATKARIHLGAADETESGLVSWGWFPVLALQSEQADNLKNEPSGSVTRLKGAVDLKILPFNPLNFEVGIGYNLWYNFTKSGPFERYHRTQMLFKAYATYWFTDNKNVGLGVDYSDGANPETNLKGDRFTSFGVKIQF